MKENTMYLTKLEWFIHIAGNGKNDLSKNLNPVVESSKSSKASPLPTLSLSVKGLQASPATKSSILAVA